jgi:ATP-binding cassette, subfamily C (CFTR/MRP), member 1
VLHGKTVIFVTNQLQYLSKCDRIIVLDSGKVAQLGTYDQLAQQVGPFAEMVKDQISAAKGETEADDTESGSEGRSKKTTPTSAHPSTAVSGKLIVAEDRATGKYVHLSRSFFDTAWI